MRTRIKWPKTLPKALKQKGLLSIRDFSEIGISEATDLPPTTRAVEFIVKHHPDQFPGTVRLGDQWNSRIVLRAEDVEAFLKRVNAKPVAGKQKSQTAES